MSAIQLEVWDYIIFGLMLLLSSVIGLYHGYQSNKNKRDSKDDYLLAGQSISWFPLFISLVASYLSAIALLGIPSEIYTYGGMYIVIMMSYPLFIFQCLVIYAPIFRRSKVTSANEYLEKRFHPAVRVFAAILFIKEYVLYLAVVLYAPSLALQAVAGVQMEISLVTIAVVCTIYTTIGGMKGVIWTDVFQTFIICVGLVVVVIIGSSEVGGIQNVFEIAERGGRMNILDFNPDPRVRNTFWSFVFGGMFSAMPVYCVGQMMVQRIMSAKSEKTVRIALLLQIPGLMVIVGLCTLAGWVIYANYEKCDLKSSGQVQSNDQILAYFLVNKLHHLKGVPGIFMASLFSGALSTASSGFNSLAAITYEDIFKKIHGELSPQQAAKVSKIIAFIYGFVVLGVAFLVNKMGTMVLQLAYAIHGVIGGPSMGMFALGMLVPWSNTVGAFLGCVCGILITTWLAVGAFIFPPDKNILPVSIEQCSIFNSTTMNATIYHQFQPHNDPLTSYYSVSYLWWGGVGIISSFVFGMIFSAIYRCCVSEEELEETRPSKELLFDYGYMWRCLTCRCSDSEEFKLQHVDKEEFILNTYHTNE
ncbi:sodium-coupled monocarboxylate transporter 2-like [Clytia hemisphaerica]|uniref:Uncharacterized protein n=1 Tax=Clytia hemisphaerica TaxID=252671 RepID=A0A7M6DL90_9CNID|eukprot:TCONS_00028408-protein